MKLEEKARVLILLSVLLVLIGPFLFSLPAFWKTLDLSQKGGIGDAIGGITAPIIGLTSVLLLFWTLLEQVRINKEQKKLNDSNRVVSLMLQLSQMENSLSFGYSTAYGIAEGHGLSSVILLNSSQSNVGIAEGEFKALYNRIKTLHGSATLLYNALSSDSTSLEPEEKHIMNNNLLMLLEGIALFYKLVAESQINVFPLMGQKESGVFANAQKESVVILNGIESQINKICEYNSQQR